MDSMVWLICILDNLLVSPIRIFPNWVLITAKALKYPKWKHLPLVMITYLVLFPSSTCMSLIPCSTMSKHVAFWETPATSKITRLNGVKNCERERIMSDFVTFPPLPSLESHGWWCSQLIHICSREGRATVWFWRSVCTCMKPSAVIWKVCSQ